MVDMNKKKPEEKVQPDTERVHDFSGVMLTSEEYDTAKGLVGFQSGRGGVITPQVQQAVNTHKEYVAAQEARMKWLGVKTIEEANREDRIRAQAEAEAGITPTTGTQMTGTPATQTPTGKVGILPGENVQPATTEQKIQNVKAEPVGLAENAFGERYAGVKQKGFGMTAPQYGGEVAKNLVPIAELINQLTPFSEYLPNVMKTEGKQVEVKDAEDTLNEAMRMVYSDIANVKSGSISPEMAQYNLNKAIEALDKLAATQKGTGKLNLRYWKSGGANVEAEIESTKIRLLQANRDLQAAKLQAQQLQINARVQQLRMGIQ